MHIDSDFMNTIDNAEVLESLLKAERYLTKEKYRTIMVSVSGGADSDLIVDMVNRIADKDKVVYVWFNTGMEYQATKDHLDYLEQRYGITIERESERYCLSRTVVRNTDNLFCQNTFQKT